VKDISREDVNDFFADYTWFLDQQRYEEWLTLFEEKSNYRVIPRENQEAGLPLPGDPVVGKPLRR